jgi:hypothetical protein
MKSTPKPQTVERRSEERQPGGNVLVKLDPGSGRLPFSCFVWDISDKGIRLKLSENSELPPIVHIVIGDVRKRARVVWRKADHVGLEFVAAIP